VPEYKKKLTIEIKNGAKINNMETKIDPESLTLSDLT
jgi:hypothetical protein